MCMSTPKPPPAPPVPAPPAPPPPVKALEPATPTGTRTNVTTQNRGRAALRIDRTTSLDGSSGSGLNIPS